MDIIILGGGISGISLAYFIQNFPKIKKIYILEKENKTGGLLRSYKFENIFYDVGPHIIFSKHKDILELNKKILNKNLNKIKRSNKIIYKNSKFIKYPFENELYKLPAKDKSIALNAFLNNPFKEYSPKNMNQFFLKTFGAGITNLYLNPYNQKIWKFDPSFLDTQMVERIPRPPDQDIIKSARGIKTEGYKHQLFFLYPKIGGIESLFKGYLKKLNKKVEILKKIKIEKIQSKKKVIVKLSNKKIIKGDYLYSSIPLNSLEKYIKTNEKIKTSSKKLLFNSIKIIMVKIKGNVAGKNFAFMVPDPNIIFHRISKLNFLGSNYSKKNYTYFQIEITYRKNDEVDKLSKNELKSQVIEGLKKIKFLNNYNKLIKYEIKNFKYSYVIYDLNHRSNVDNLINFYKKKKIFCIGRWGSWEYLNSDQVIFQSKKFADILKKKL